MKADRPSIRRDWRQLMEPEVVSPKSAGAGVTPPDPRAGEGEKESAPGGTGQPPQVTVTGNGVSPTQQQSSTSAVQVERAGASPALRSTNYDPETPKPTKPTPPYQTIPPRRWRQESVGL